MLITNIKLFDGTSDNLIEDSSIWVEDNLMNLNTFRNSLIIGVFSI